MLKMLTETPLLRCLLLLLLVSAAVQAKPSASAKRRARITAAAAAKLTTTTTTTKSAEQRSDGGDTALTAVTGGKSMLPSAVAVAAAAAEATTSKPATKLKTSAANVASKYEIRGVAGEPNYKSVNLTWEVEFVPASSSAAAAATAATAAAKRERPGESQWQPNNTNDTNVNDVNGNGVTNMSVDVEPPKAFQIFYCEMQNYGPQRCRVKLVNGTAAQTHPMASQSGQQNEQLSTPEADASQVQHFAALVDNLRMATKYSFHIRPASQPAMPRRPSLRVSGARAELFSENEIESELSRGHLPGQSIVIPTKGFSAHATQCLPHASEIEVETGPYFGGRIVVDGGSCGVKGNAADPADKYTMRIDHKVCGSLLKPASNTVETFITVQENLGIFTHSTRRFVVVCSYQSGMQTVRASFTVPGKQGVAAAYEPASDPFEPDDQRLGREIRHMRFVNKSELVLKEADSAEPEQLLAATEASSELYLDTESEQQAEVHEMAVSAEPQQVSRQQGRALSLDSLDAANSLVAGEQPAAPTQTLEPLHTKYAKLVVEQPGQAQLSYDAKSVRLRQRQEGDDDIAVNNDEAVAATLHYISGNLGSVLVTVSISVIIICICIIVVHRFASQPAQRERLCFKSNMALQRPAPSPAKHQPHKTLPRALQPQYQCTL